MQHACRRGEKEPSADVKGKRFDKRVAEIATCPNVHDSAGCLRSCPRLGASIFDRFASATEEAISLVADSGKLESVGDNAYFAEPRMAIMRECGLCRSSGLVMSQRRRIGIGRPVWAKSSGCTETARSDENRPWWCAWKETVWSPSSAQHAVYIQQKVALH